MTDEKKLDIEGWDGTPGDAYDKFELRLMNLCSKSDDRGWSYADHLKGQDEGGPTGPEFPIPAGGTEGRKATATFRRRQKESYSILTRHITSQEIVDVLTRDHFQDGRAAFLTTAGGGGVAVDRLRLDDMDSEWRAISIMHDIGVNENTIPLLCNRIRHVNAKRPQAQQKDETEQAEELLECLFKATKHFQEGALIEYQAAVGGRVGAA